MIIGVEGLSAAEVGLLRTILKLSTQLVIDWSLSEEGPCDLLLTTSALEPGLVHAGRQAQIVVPIVRRGEAPAGECLEHPFRAEDFVALLGRVGPALKINATAPRQAEAVTVSADRRGRLKRWPPSQLMGSSRERIHLATLLSRRSRSVRELSAVAGYPEAACDAFMLELEKHDLLSWEISEHPRQAPPAMPVSRKEVAGHGAPGLFSSIRRRLGLSRNSRSSS